MPDLMAAIRRLLGWRISQDERQYVTDQLEEQRRRIRLLKATDAQVDATRADAPR